MIEIKSAGSLEDFIFLDNGERICISDKLWLDKYNKKTLVEVFRRVSVWLYDLDDEQEISVSSLCQILSNLTVKVGVLFYIRSVFSSKYKRRVKEVSLDIEKILTSTNRVFNLAMYLGGRFGISLKQLDEVAFN